MAFTFASLALGSPPNSIRALNFSVFGTAVFSTSPIESPRSMNSCACSSDSAVNVPGFRGGGGGGGTGTFCGRCSFTAAAPLSGHGHGPESAVRSSSRLSPNASFALFHFCWLRHRINIC